VTYIGNKEMLSSLADCEYKKLRKL